MVIIPEKDLAEILVACEYSTVSEWIHKFGIKMRSRNYCAYKEIFLRFYTEGVGKFEDIEADSDSQYEFESGDEDPELTVVDEEKELKPHNYYAKKARESFEEKKAKCKEKIVEDLFEQYQDFKRNPIAIENYKVWLDSEHKKIKINEYKGQRYQYIFYTSEDVIAVGELNPKVSKPENINCDSVRLQRGQPIAMATVYHFWSKKTGEHQDSRKAKACFYLTEFASTPRLKYFKARRGEYFLNRLKTEVVKDKPMFLGLDPQDRENVGLMKYYKSQGFHTTKEMKTNQHPVWREWQEFLQNAAKKKWGYVLVCHNPKVPTREKFFDEKMLDEKRNLCMVYWSKWEEKYESEDHKEDVAMGNHYAEACHGDEIPGSISPQEKPPRVQEEADGASAQQAKLCLEPSDVWLSDLRNSQLHDTDDLSDFTYESYKDLFEKYEACKKQEEIKQSPYKKENTKTAAVPYLKEFLSHKAGYIAYIKSRTIHYFSKFQCFVLYAKNTGNILNDNGQVLCQTERGTVYGFVSCVFMLTKKIEVDAPHLIYINDFFVYGGDNAEVVSRTFFVNQMMLRLRNLSDSLQRPLILETDKIFSALYETDLRRNGFHSGYGLMGYKFESFFQTWCNHGDALVVTYYDGKFHDPLKNYSKNWKNFLCYWGLRSSKREDLHTPFHVLFPNEHSANIEVIWNDAGYNISKIEEIWTESVHEEPWKVIAEQLTILNFDAVSSVMLEPKPPPAQREVICDSGIQWALKTIQQGSAKAHFDELKDLYLQYGSFVSIRPNEFDCLTDAVRPFDEAEGLSVETDTGGYIFSHKVWVLYEPRTLEPMGFARVYEFKGKDEASESILKTFVYLAEAYGFLDFLNMQYYYNRILKDIQERHPNVPILLAGISSKAPNKEAFEQILENNGFARGVNLKEKMGEAWSQFFTYLSMTTDTKAQVRPGESHKELHVVDKDPNLKISNWWFHTNSASEWEVGGTERLNSVLQSRIAEIEHQKKEAKKLRNEGYSLAKQKQGGRKLKEHFPSKKENPYAHQDPTFHKDGSESQPRF